MALVIDASVAAWCIQDEAGSPDRSVSNMTPSSGRDRKRQFAMPWRAVGGFLSCRRPEFLLLLRDKAAARGWGWTCASDFSGSCSRGKANKGLDRLRERGAEAWPELRTPEAIKEILDAPRDMKPGVPPKIRVKLRRAFERSGGFQPPSCRPGGQDCPPF